MSKKMKKFFSLMLVALVMLGVTACEQDVTIDTPKSEGLSFYAEIAMTRADLVQGTDDSKWATVWEGNETLYVNNFEFTNTVDEPSKFTCTTEGVADLVGKPVTIKMENNSVPESGKGIMIEQSITAFDPTSTITLKAKNAFLHFTYTGDVTFKLSDDLFVVNGDLTNSITVTAEGDSWVSVLPGTGLMLSYTIDGIKCKEKSDFAINAGKIYYLNSKVEITDTLNRALTGATSNSYIEWKDKTVTSTAVYAGQSAGGNESIQLRSNNSNSGIVTTASGGKVTKVVVTWNSNTTAGRTLNIYGKNTAYTAATDLYSTSTQGTKIGTIVCGTSTELVIEGDYEYIGMRSNSGAMYLNEISITWKSQMDMSPTLNVSRNEINFLAEGGKETFTIYKNFVDEVIVSCDNFSVVANEDDTYTVSANPNALSEVIEGKITVRCGTLSQTITVSQAAKSTDTWTLVTDASDLKAGDQIIIAASDYDYALSTTQKSNNRGQAAITKGNGTATFGEDVQILTVEAGITTGTFAFNTGSGYLYAASSTENLLRTEATLSDNSSWKITIDAATGIATIIAQGTNTRNYMQYNSTSTLFACYDSEKPQKDIAIYKLTVTE